jgi:L-ornithine N5-oxygenase
VDLIMRARSIKPSDDSPFVNEIFNTDFTDYVFNSPEQERSKILDEFWHTNYAAPDLILIEQIFNVLYQQKVSGIERHRFLRRHEVRKAIAQSKGIQFTLHDLNTDNERTVTYDAVVLATGYHRDHYKSLLAPLIPYFEDLTVDRQYRVCSAPHFKPAIFLQGACESSHGLSDTLLSVMAIRTSEIAQALVNTLSQSKGVQAKRKMSSALA